MRHVIRSAILILVALFLLLPIASPVFAIADPDSPPAVNGVWVYHDLLEDGDVGVLVDYFIDYAAPPTETATEAYLAAFIDTDGSTILRATALYTYVDSGYGHGYIWTYFTPTEVAAYSIDSADSALYSVWLMGNPTLAWAGDPPKTTAGIDYWQPASTSTATLFALRILAAADGLELDWSLDMIEATPLGNKLTAIGEEYFVNVVPNLRTIAPAAFSSGTEMLTPADIDYSLDFGAEMTDGTGTVAGSPITLTEGVNNVNVTVAGTFTIELTRGTVGTVEDNTGAVTGSPVEIVWGVNTITVPGGGTGLLTVTVTFTSLAAQNDAAISGGALDVSGAAADWGLSRWMLGGLAWLALTIFACALLYKADTERDTYTGGGSKVVMILFVVLMGIGVAFKVVHPDVGTIMIILFGGALNYVIWLKPSST
jgi:hypothetical protein